MIEAAFVTNGRPAGATGERIRPRALEAHRCEGRQTLRSQLVPAAEAAGRTQPGAESAPATAQATPKGRLVDRLRSPTRLSPAKTAAVKPQDHAGLRAQTP